MTARLMDGKKMEESIQHLTNPLDHAINEKCSRIKRAFMEIMDEYSAHYYIISGHSPFNAKNSGKVWYKRLKVILLPRHLLAMDNQGLSYLQTVAIKRREDLEKRNKWITFARKIKKTISTSGQGTVVSRCCRVLPRVRPPATACTMKKKSLGRAHRSERVN